MFLFFLHSEETDVIKKYGKSHHPAEILQNQGDRNMEDMMMDTSGDEMSFAKAAESLRSFKAQAEDVYTKV